VCGFLPMPRRKSVTFELSESEDENIADSDFDLENENASRLKRRRRASSSRALSDSHVNDAETRAESCFADDISMEGSPPRRPRGSVVYESADLDAISVDLDHREPESGANLKPDSIDEQTDDVEASHESGECELPDNDVQQEGDRFGRTEDDVDNIVDGTDAVLDTTHSRRDTGRIERTRGSEDGSDAGSEWDDGSVYGASDDSAGDSESDYEEVELKKRSKANRTSSKKEALSPKTTVSRTVGNPRKKASSSSAKALQRQTTEASCPKGLPPSLVVKKALGVRRVGSSSLAPGLATTTREVARGTAPSLTVGGPRLRVGLSRNARVPRLHSYLEK
jgi:hypothetical protein